MGWGGVLTFCPRRTSKYVTNFSNHVHGVGWGGVGWGINVLSAKNFQVRYFSNHVHGAGWGGVGH